MHENQPRRTKDVSGKRGATYTGRSMYQTSHLRSDAAGFRPPGHRMQRPIDRVAMNCSSEQGMSLLWECCLNADYVYWHYVNGC